MAQRDYIPLTFMAVYAVLSLFALLHFLHCSYLGDWYFVGRTSFNATLNGTAWKPFVYRLLIPKLTQAITFATPETLQAGINASLYSLKEWHSLDGFRAAFPWFGNLFPDQGSIYPRTIAIFMIYGCLLGYIIMLQKLSLALFPLIPAIARFAPIFGLLAISSFSLPMQYLYDIPVLFLSCACYYAMVSRKPKTYLVFFTLACLNKETSLFILILFLFWNRTRLDRKTYLFYSLAQCVIYAVIKISITTVYAANPGAILEQHFAQTFNDDWLTPASHTRILYLCIWFFLLTYQWAVKPDFLKYTFFLMPVIAIAYLLFGKPGEYRVLMDILPLLTLLVTHTLISTAGFTAREKHEND